MRTQFRVIHSDDKNLSSSNFQWRLTDHGITENCLAIYFRYIETCEHHLVPVWQCRDVMTKISVCHIFSHNQQQQQWQPLRIDTNKSDKTFIAYTKYGIVPMLIRGAMRYSISRRLSLYYI